MQKEFHYKLVFLLFLGMFLTLPVTGRDKTALAAEQVILIGSQNFPVNSLSKTNVRDIYLAKKKRLDGKMIEFVTLKKGDIQQTFLKNYVSQTKDQYNRYWKMQVFTGKGKPPRSFENEAALAAYVANSSNVIGYISNKITPENVKVLRIQ